MTLRERLQWMSRMALMIFILASVAFLSALTAMRFAIQGREVTMPDVVGMKPAEAQQTLQGRGIGMKIEDRIYSSLPADAVVRQIPPPHMRVKIGQYAHVVLSLGPQKATIPQLTEMSLRVARIELMRGGMQAGEIASAYLPGWPEDTVIQQDPVAGTSDVSSPHVDLLVSIGAKPAAFVMPDLSGLPLGEGESKLTGAGLKVAKLTISPIPDLPHGTIAQQVPARGARVDASTSIELQVAQ
jgi:serine/threonine-protein kinase